MMTVSGLSKKKYAPQAMSILMENNICNKDVSPKRCKKGPNATTAACGNTAARDKIVDVDIDDDVDVDVVE